MFDYKGKRDTPTYTYTVMNNSGFPITEPLLVIFAVSLVCCDAELTKGKRERQTTQCKVSNKRGQKVALSLHYKNISNKHHLRKVLPTNVPFPKAILLLVV